MDDTLPDFDPLATYNDGTCTFAIAGCTSSIATNYRRAATIDDGTCSYLGCTDSLASNFDPSANQLGICIDAVPGCTDSLATNFASSATQDDIASCVYVGCTDSTRTNYNPTSTADDGRCAPLFPGCMDPAALNYNTLYTADDASCSFGGCTDTSSLYYSPTATFNDGNCSVPTPTSSSRRRMSLGCMDPRAVSSYSEAYTSHEPSSCTYSVRGCTDTMALNYFAAATEDSGACSYPILGCTLPECAVRDPEPCPEPVPDLTSHHVSNRLRNLQSIHKNISLPLLAIPSMQCHSKL